MPKQTGCQGRFLQRQVHNDWTVVQIRSGMLSFNSLRERNTDILINGERYDGARTVMQTAYLV